MKDRDVVERTVLFCRHLDHQQLGKFAGYLTKSNINFFFPSKNTVVIEVSGIDASVLVQLMHYAEVPIPTTEIQGAFSVCIRGVETFARDHSLIDCRMSFGRIGTLSSFPLQIRCCDLGASLPNQLNGPPSMNGSSESCQGLTFKLSPVLMRNKLLMNTCSFEFPRQTMIAFPATIPLGIATLGSIMRSLFLLLTKLWSDHLTNRPCMNIGSSLCCRHQRRGKDA